jgi:hypothetical protein
MSTLRIYLPYGAHLRFDGVEKVSAASVEYIAFTYTARDDKGNATDRKANAVFNTKTIAGYSVEAE